MDKKKSYLCALLLGLLTVIICLAVADGMIGVAGTIHNRQENEFGEYSYELHVKDPTGRIIFWAGLLLLPIPLARFIAAGHTWVNLPLYTAAWYLLSAIFGSHANHRFLAHPAGGFISIGEELTAIATALCLWLVQLMVLLAVKGVCKLIRLRKTGASAA